MLLMNVEMVLVVVVMARNCDCPIQPSQCSGVYCDDGDRDDCLIAVVVVVMERH